MKNLIRTGYHLIPNSPWPLLASLGTYCVLVELLVYFYSNGTLECPCRLMQVLLFLGLVLGTWWRDVCREASYIGYHTRNVQKLIRYGVFLFIVSEIMFFFSFFWAFFHSSLAPSPFIGNVWPPKGILLPPTLGWPFLGTIILLTSRFAVTYTHREVRRKPTSSKWGPWLKLNYQLGVAAWYYLVFIPERWEKLEFYAIRHNYCLRVYEERKKLRYKVSKKTHKEIYQEALKGWLKKLSEESQWSDPLEKFVITSFYFLKRWTIKSFFSLVLIIHCNMYKKIVYYLIYWNSYTTARLRLFLGIMLGIIFLRLQLIEYTHLGFNVNRGVYGSVFYLTTGFHGLHVTVGVIFLFVQWKRIQRRHFSQADHVGLEGAIWYWHFVDVVWLVLYGGVYCWGNWSPWIWI